MSLQQPSSYNWQTPPTLHVQRSKNLRRADALAQLAGTSAVIVGHGLRRTGIIPWEFGGATIVTMLVISLGIFFRFRWSLARPSFARRHLWTVLAALTWVGGMILVTIIGPILPDTNGTGVGGPRWWGYVHLSEAIVVLYTVTGIIRGLRNFTAGGVNPAYLLVTSFLMLITIGTILLMLPACRNIPLNEPLKGASFQDAFFTATSASCVTGLIVVDTGTHWSWVGQTVIMCLFQIGGLGIMTFSAFFAVIAGRNVRLGEFANLRDLLSSGSVGDVRKLILSILGLTFLAESIGAVLLLPLFADQPYPRRAFLAIFHAISAFCNAGFALTENSFVGMADTWCVSVVVAGLIIVGGLGFSVHFNLGTYLWTITKELCQFWKFHTPHKRHRLRLETKLVLASTTVLLLGGFSSIYLLERTGVNHESAISVSDAWFQAVTFRTAGFNTVDLGELQPATKLVAIFLMMIGASPGSTGGGMKTIVFAVGVVGLITVIRGRNKVEVFGRSLSETTLNRAMAIVFASICTVMLTTILIVIFEGRPELFLDHLFEATSAVGTVGVSSTVPVIVDSTGTTEFMSTTFSLSSPSRFVIIVAMFLGRIGPLTLLLALAREGQQVRFEYPTERVNLG